MQPLEQYLPDKPEEACGVFGAYTTDREAASLGLLSACMPCSIAAKNPLALPPLTGTLRSTATRIWA